MRHHRIAGAGLAVAAGLVGMTVGLAAPASADPGPGIGQNVCPLLANSGSGLVSAASTVSNAASGITGKSGPSPEMAQMFAQMALSSYCPTALSAFSNGRLPDVPGVFSDAPGSTGLFEGGLPSLTALPGQ
ncbi:DUF732 domain-containing protein [Mycobacterium sp. M1]|uniref:DUF732 domain-containing protein n=1 Tax=Mycolicibacter acidiphilus TaxID=2835306 RepID=A0ABS5RF34_9MYCO|nr:DUF732 domain-containing protein [Mycolicibacter acidiphilus]MBS9532888.1 DUF732 domain-containing protein [Mycolicibacter acidiphilus]